MPTKRPTPSRSTATKSKPRSSELAQAGRFGLVGIANTLIDFLIATVLASILGAAMVYFSIGSFSVTGVIIASVISGCLAMVFSYVANMRFTFRAHAGGLRQAILFFLITGFGLVILRPIIINAVTIWWTYPVDLGYSIAQVFGLPIKHDTVLELVGIVAAIVVIWPYNYLMYKNIIFKAGEK